jgi:protein-tyrosine-phosphatase
MAEALVEHRSAGTVEARSAGSHPKPLHPNAVRVMAEHGIDISDRPTKPLTRFTRTRFDRVISATIHQTATMYQMNSIYGTPTTTDDRHLLACPGDARPL